MVKWGILSTARINNEALIEPIRKRDDSFVKAVASRSSNYVKAYAQLYNIPIAYTTYEELIKDPQIEAIYISTPNAMHVKWAEMALKHNKHVLCEKPIVLKRQELDSLLKLAEEKNLVLMEALHYNYYPSITTVINKIKNGVLGRIQRAYAELNLLKPPQDDIRYKIECAGGAFMHLGCYCIHFLQSIMHEPLKLKNIEIKHNNTHIDTFCHATLGSLTDDTTLEFNCNLEDKKLNSFITVQGEEGEITIKNFFNPIQKEKEEYKDILVFESSIPELKISPLQNPLATYDYQLDFFLQAIKQKNLNHDFEKKCSTIVEKGWEYISCQAKLQMISPYAA